MKPAGLLIPAGFSYSNQSTNLLAFPAVTAGIGVAASMAGVSPTVATSMGKGSAAVKCGAPSEGRMPVAVVANHRALAVKLSPTGTAGAALRTVAPALAVASVGMGGRQKRKNPRVWPMGGL